VDAPFDLGLPGLTHFRREFQRRPAFVDQVETHVSGSVAVPATRLAAAGAP